MSDNRNSSGGIGCLGVIFLILLVLKLFGLISISWWWVFSPVFIGLGITLICVLILLFINS